MCGLDLQCEEKEEVKGSLDRDWILSQKGQSKHTPKETPSYAYTKHNIEETDKDHNGTLSIQWPEWPPPLEQRLPVLRLLERRGCGGPGLFSLMEPEPPPETADRVKGYVKKRRVGDIVEKISHRSNRVAWVTRSSWDDLSCVYHFLSEHTTCTYQYTSHILVFYMYICGLLLSNQIGGTSRLWLHPRAEAGRTLMIVAHLWDVDSK